MSQALATYLRTHRVKLGLTQQELAFLLGLTSSQAVSRYEVQGRLPSLQTAFACMILFDEYPHRIFPGEYKQVEQLLITYVQSLLKTIEQHPPSLQRDYKIGMLNEVVERVRLHAHNS